MRRIVTPCVLHQVLTRPRDRDCREKGTCQTDHSHPMCFADRVFAALAATTRGDHGEDTEVATTASTDTWEAKRSSAERDLVAWRAQQRSTLR